MDSLELLLIERECERLVVAYTHATDLRDGEGLADLFTEDGVLAAGPEPRAGRAAIREASQANRGARLMRHVCSNLLVQVTGPETATGVCYLTAYVNAAGDQALGLPAVVGEYHDEFRRTAEGWRIASRRFVPALIRPA